MRFGSFLECYVLLCDESQTLVKHTPAVQVAVVGCFVIYRVTESKNKDYPVGTVVLTSCGWTTHSVSDGSGLTKVEHMPEGLPLSFAIGAAGMPG